jgi:hypothetical protein
MPVAKVQNRFLEQTSTICVFAKTMQRVYQRTTNLIMRCNAAQLAVLPRIAVLLIHSVIISRPYSSLTKWLNAHV